MIRLVLAEEIMKLLYRSRLTGSLALLASGFILGPNIGAQTTLDTADVTFNYVGIGPITWPKSPKLKAIVGVPHFSSGPTIRCPEYVHKCEIDVVLRSTQYYVRTEQQLIAELKEQFDELDPPLPPNAMLRTHTSPRRLEVTFVDDRPSAKYRFTTAALVIKGPAVMQIFAQSNDSLSNALVLAVATQAKILRQREFMAYRFGQYARACNERVPASKTPNERAIAASPFTDEYLLESARQRDSTFTLGKLQEARANADKSFLDALDELEPKERELFCNGLPRFVRDAADEL